MREQEFDHAQPSPDAAVAPSTGHARELWSLHGAFFTLRGLGLASTFGEAFALELDREIVSLHLLPDRDTLLEYAFRTRDALLAQGWQRTDQSSPSAKERS